jgi:hypothetical protein
MSTTELKMQPTIHLERKAYPALRCKCIVGCIFNSVVRIITREIPSIYLHLKNSYTFPCLSISWHAVSI